MSKIRDLVVIEGGAGGLVVASVAAQPGLDVVLINKSNYISMKYPGLIHYERYL